MKFAKLWKSFLPNLFLLSGVGIVVLVAGFATYATALEKKIMPHQGGPGPVRLPQPGEVLQTDADGTKTYVIYLQEGSILPHVLEVPAKVRFRLNIRNANTTPSEFENLSLHKERIIGPGTQSNMIFYSLNAGDYIFVDEMHPGAQMTLRAR